MVAGKGEKVLSMSKSNGYSCNKSSENRVSSFMFFNFPDTWSRADCWKVFANYGALTDVYLARKRLSSGQRFGFVRFEDISDTDCFAKILNNIQINGRWIRAFKAFDRKTNVAKPSEGDVGMKFENVNTKVDFPAAHWKHVSPQTSKWEGTSFADTLRGNIQSIPVSNRIEIKVGGKCFEFNFPTTVSNHNLVFSYNKERLSWTLVQVNNMSFEFDAKDDIKSDVEVEQCMDFPEQPSAPVDPHGANLLFEHKKSSDVHCCANSHARLSILSPAKDAGKDEVFPAKIFETGVLVGESQGSHCSTPCVAVSGYNQEHGLPEVIDGNRTFRKMSAEETINSILKGSLEMKESPSAFNSLGLDVSNMQKIDMLCAHVDRSDGDSLDNGLLKNGSNVGEVTDEPAKEIKVHVIESIVEPLERNQSLVDDVEKSIDIYGDCKTWKNQLISTESDISNIQSDSIASTGPTLDNTVSKESCMEKRSRFRYKKNRVWKSKHGFFNYIMGRAPTKRKRHRDGLRWTERIYLNRLMEEHEADDEDDEVSCSGDEDDDASCSCEDS